MAFPPLGMYIRKTNERGCYPHGRPSPQNIHSKLKNKTFLCVLTMSMS